MDHHQTSLKGPKPGPEPALARLLNATEPDPDRPSANPEHNTPTTRPRDHTRQPRLLSSLLVVCRGFSEGGSSSLDLGDDVFGGLGPGERLGVVVPR